MDSNSIRRIEDYYSAYAMVDDVLKLAQTYDEISDTLAKTDADKVDMPSVLEILKMTKSRVETSLSELNILKLEGVYYRI